MNTDPIVGGDLLRLVTAGMYDNPLVLYREYLQNAADAIASRGCGSVHVRIDRLRSRVSILDDGTGLPPGEVAQRLIDVGCSTKDHTVDRGFRGIGRLAGIAFADQVEFTTRTNAAEPVTHVTWSARSLREASLAQMDVATAIDRCTTIRQTREGNWPERFFRVSVEGVHRHSASLLLNEDAVRRYIGEVCPVPMADSFPLAADVGALLRAHTDHLVLRVRINDDPRPIERPFAEAIPLTKSYSAPFERVETRVVPAVDGNDPAAIVWLAHTPYAGSIPRRLGVRGLRARIGNIQIGTDRIFEHLFLEPRFNGWCIGEVHILDKRLLPNGRRDYFEPSPHLRNIENHIGALAQEVSARCRRASSQRNKIRNIDAAVHRLRRARDLVLAGYLRPSDAAALADRERKRIPGIRHALTRIESVTPASNRDTLGRLDSELDALDLHTAPPLRRVPPDSVAAVQGAFGVIAETMPPDVALGVIERILDRLGGSRQDDGNPEAGATDYRSRASEASSRRLRGIKGVTSGGTVSSGL